MTKYLENLKRRHEDLTFNEIKTKEKFINKKGLGSFRLMFPKFNDTNISLLTVHIYHSFKLA